MGASGGGVRKVVDCRVCGGTDWQEVVSFGPVPLANGFLDPTDSYDGEPYYPLGVISCRSCRLLSVTHIVDPEILYRDYPYVTSDSDTITRHMRYVADTCRERFGLSPGSFVVEVGSNTGSQLMPFQDAGMRVLGVDPARNLARVAAERGVETLPDFFSAETASAIARGHGRARLILARHVFAHIDHVAGVVQGVRGLLSEEGVFAVEVPYLLDLFGQNAFDTIYHEHLSYFSVGTLVSLFERHGMRLFDVERLAVHGGSILVFVQRDDGPWPVRPAVGELLELERRAELDGDAVYRDFALNVDRVRDELPALVRRLAAEGKRIAGYGASAKGNTILNVCGFRPGELEFCSDTTSLKQGKVLPGTHVPVCSPEYAKAHAPDYYLLLAWNYSDEILRKEAGFLSGGGRFIRPIPKPVVVSADAL
ncbi:Methyltransferase domain-containing protein [Thermomonospora echinospora]|uniref:Methyltransferase domain-containing protein n=1 Tax=Thermomonospora echinospora TaxID=1992 RepID=A0A1H5TS48_9ACTN|nr:class I SAM-dependent methyltransferase [Thermomonospora echinospora]SEF65614.1 Methyltransferase domain-containing protein [Thermomonospora echinospora]